MSKARLYLGVHVAEAPGAFVETALLAVSPAGLELRAFRLQPPPAPADDWAQTLAWAVRGLIWQAGVFLHDIDGLGVKGPPPVEAAAPGLAEIFERPIAFGFADPAAARDAWMAGFLATAALEAGMSGPGALVRVDQVMHFVGWSGAQDAWSFDVGPARALRLAWLRAHDLDEDADFDALAGLGQADGATVSVLCKQAAFDRKAPRRIEPEEFSIAPLQRLSLPDGAATLVSYETANLVSVLAGHFVRRVVLCGPGRMSAPLQGAIRIKTSAEAVACERLGLRDETLAAMAAAANTAFALEGLPNAAAQTTSALFAQLGPSIARPNQGGGR